MDADQELVNQQEADKAKLEQQKATLDEKQKELQKQFQELQQKESEMEVKKAENQAKSLALKAQIATKQEEERLEAERKAAEEEAARLRALQAARPVVNVNNSNSHNSNKNNNSGSKPQPIVVGSGAGNASSGDAISTAKQFLGRAYVWGGSNPTTGFDCSGLVQWSYKQAGVSLPRTASQQYLATKRISASEARVGDLVFFSYGSGVAHVGIYLGNNTMIDAQNKGVVIESLDWWNQYLVGFGRIQ